MIVPPGTAFSAAAVTLSAAVPVSTVSPGPWATVAGLAAAVGVVVLGDDELLAAPAAPTGPTAMAAAATVAASRRRLRERMDCMGAPCRSWMTHPASAPILRRAREQPKTSRRAPARRYDRAVRTPAAAPGRITAAATSRQR